MSLQTNIVRRGAVYYHRISVPTDLTALLRRREVWRSLKTTDAQRARRLAVAAQRAAIAFFDACRDRDVLTDDEIARMVQDYYERELAVDAESRRKPGRQMLTDKHALETEREILRNNLAGRRHGYATAPDTSGHPDIKFAQVSDLADSLLDPEGYPRLHTEAERPLSVDRAAPDHLALCQALLRTKLELVDRMLAGFMRQGGYHRH